MELEITPEPSPQERAAIVAALARALAGEGAAQGLGPWWETGLRERLEEGEPEE